MAQNTTIDVPSDWVLLTDADVTEVTFQNIGYNGTIYVLGTNGTSQPTAEDGLIYRPREGESKVLLADLFPGVSGVNRLWAKGAGTTSKVFVSHA
jgi:hypothetical protein